MVKKEGKRGRDCRPWHVCIQSNIEKDEQECAYLSKTHCSILVLNREDFEVRVSDTTESVA